MERYGIVEADTGSFKVGGEGGRYQSATKLYDKSTFASNTNWNMQHHLYQLCLCSISFVVSMRHATKTEVRIEWLELGKIFTEQRLESGLHGVSIER